MLVNARLTVYHKDFDKEKRIEKWIRFNYGTENKNAVWWHGGKGASIDKGFENANDVKIRIPYNLNSELNVKNFAIGDILVKGTINEDIDTLQDLNGEEIYTIMSIVDNQFGNETHIHIGGK